MPPFSLAEIVLVTQDMPASLRFYRDAIGLPLEKDPNEGWAWFRLDDPPSNRPQRLALRNGSLLFQEHSPRTDLPEADRLAGPMHFALQIQPDDVEPTLQRAREHGIELFGPADLGWMNATAWYCYDPSGNLVELWMLNPPSSR